MRNNLIITLLLCASCLQQVQKNKEKTKKFYYLRNYRDGLDTIDRKVVYHSPKDSLIGSRTFKIKGESHQIKMFTTDNYAAIDGGELFYELDSLGIIYSRSTTWYGYTRLYSNNDSLNRLINQALENIILYPDLHCYGCELVDKTTVSFDPPKIE